MATSTIPRVLTLQDMKIYKSTGSPKTATITSTNSGRWVVAVATIRGASVSNYAGFYIVHGYGSSSSYRKITTLASASDVTVTATNDGFTVSCPVNLVFVVYVLLDINNDVSVSFS